ncbi:MAG: peptidylprolyl isomerase, partial [Thermodesulfobacteriota bacterium]
LVERNVVLREGARRGITVPFAALEEEVTRYRADFPEGGLEKALVQVGMSAQEWRERVRGSLLYRRSADAIASSLVSVTPEEVAEAYRKEARPAGRPERIRLRQFLFESESIAESAREGLRERFRGGGDSGAGGVDLGFFSKEELPGELPPGLFGMEVGEVSGPVVLDCSVSLFRVEAREAAGAHTAESEEERIRESLLAARREEAFRRWLSRAAMNASVRVHAELLKKLYEEKR